MPTRSNFSFPRQYRKLYIGVRQWCNHLTIKQRKIIVYGLSFFYLLCGLVMVAQSFLAQEEELSIPRGMWEESSQRIDKVIYETNNTP